MLKMCNNKTEKTDNISSFNKIETIILFIFISVVSMFIGIFIGKSKNISDIDIIKFAEDFKNIEDSYYGELDKESLLKKALETIIDEIDDPYSTVVDQDLSNSLNTQLQGSYKGIGIEVANNVENDILIVGIIEDSPASKVNLESGDIIIKINNEDVSKKDTSILVEKIKTFDGNKLTLTVKRNEKEIIVEIVKETVVLDSTTSKIIKNGENKIGYIYINVFAANTGEQFIDELNKLKKNKIDSIIIDVRNNSGGHLVAVEQILNKMIKSDKVIFQLESKLKREKIYSNGKTDEKLPIVILIDNNSASGSELLAASLKENLNAILVGKTSFGKGTVQEVQNADNISIQYKLTTKKWLTPNGNWIHEKGINPDYEVDLDESYLKNPCDATDKQLQKAIEVLNK